ncbi:hypothetical protein [Desulforhopalus sp. IMCC35007]|uniref:hypothetical protein n=1 Tax=Desulforhopalus sp. IMCC35007 TaxID=2569543 RepID=UPI00145EF2AE|nr:hypothetical protein [Desulforhopalus sp. IMCC35007]
MNELLIIGIIVIAVIAITTLGIRVVIKFRSGNKITMRDIEAGGDVVGRDKITKSK